MLVSKQYPSTIYPIYPAVKFVIGDSWVFIFTVLQINTLYLLYDSVFHQFVDIRQH